MKVFSNFIKKIRKLKNGDTKNISIVNNIVGSFIIKGASLFISLATVPAFMAYFPDSVVLGVWYTIISIAGWMLNFDLGAGNGLRNKLVVALADEDRRECRRLISSAYCSVGIACLVLLLILAPLVDIIDWNMIYGVSSKTISLETLRFVTLMVLCGMAIQLFLKNVTAILYAMQLSAINNLLNFFVSVLQLLCILLLPAMDAEQALKTMSVIYSIASNLPALIATLLLFWKPLSFARPSPHFVSKKAIRQVFGLGMLFFGAQLLYMLIVNTNEVFISSLFGAKYVVEYQIYYRLYSLIGTLVSLALTPVWSAVTLALVQKDGAWLRQLFRRLELLGLLAAIIEFIIVPFSQAFFNIWLGNQSISTSFPTALSFAVFGALFSYQSVVASFANGFGHLATQLKYYSIGVVIKIMISVCAAQMGLSWYFVIVGDAFALLPFCIMQRRKCIKEIERVS